MSFTKVTEADKVGKTNVGMPDTPGLNTSEMQILLDALPNLAIDKLNNLIDELEATTAARNIGAVVPEGFEANSNLQSILNNMVLTLKRCDNARHSHNNKDTLDAITDDVKGDYDRLVILLTAIELIAESIQNGGNNASIPTTKAVVDYCADLDIDIKARKAAYPIGSEYCTTSSIAVAQIMGFGRWTLEYTDSHNIKHYLRRE